jgi:2-C-methyl-D-erythritol 4-phosphate cytidylyltransferase
MRDMCKDDDIVLIHDGVRPLINRELISANIAHVKKFGSAITVEPALESVIHSSDGELIDAVPARNEFFTAKAPQSFLYGEIWNLHQRAKAEGVTSIDSAHLCSIYNVKIHMVIGPHNNMKITAPADYYIFRALYEAMENQQVLGVGL